MVLETRGEILCDVCIRELLQRTGSGSPHRAFVREPSLRGLDSHRKPGWDVSPFSHVHD